MNDSKLTFKEEMERWHRFSDNAIGDKCALLVLFVATVSPDLKDKVYDAAFKSIEKEIKQQKGK